MLSVFKLVFFFGWGKWGWTETFYYTTSAGAADVRSACVAYAAMRVQALGTGQTQTYLSNPYLEAARYEDITSFQLTGLGQGASILLYPPSISTYGTADLIAGPIDNAGLIEIADATATIRRQFLATGLPNVWLPWFANGGTSTNAGFTAWISKLTQVLTKFVPVENGQPTAVNPGFAGNFAVRRGDQDGCGRRITTDL